MKHLKKEGKEEKPKKSQSRHKKPDQSSQKTGSSGGTTNLASNQFKGKVATMPTHSREMNPQCGKIFK